MATLDILTFKEAEAAINMVGTSVNHAPELELWNTAVSQRIDDLCGPVVIRAISDELVDAPDGRLYTSESPLYAVTSISEYVSGNATALTAETVSVAGTYRVVGAVGSHNRHLERRSGWTSIGWSGQVLISYSAGRYTTTEDVGAKFKVAAKAILAGMWQKYSASWSRGGESFGDPVLFDELDPVIRRWLADELRPPAVA